MAKKRTSSRRPNIPQETLNRARREAGLTTDAPAPTSTKDQPKRKATPAPAPKVANVTAVDLAREYAYVIIDLRNMGLLAAALFVMLIVLALIIV